MKEAHKAGNIADIDSATTELNNAWQAASQDIYSAQQAQGNAQQTGSQAGAGSQGASSAKSDSDNVTDVEFEEVK